MSRISGFLAQILSAVYGKDVRQSIHDAIEQCYTDVSNAKTIAEAATNNANTAASNAESRTKAAISSMQTDTNTAIGNCNSATTAANTAATNANTKANAANTAAGNADASKQACDAAVAALPGQLKDALDDLGLSIQNGKLCVKVERSD